MRAGHFFQSPAEMAIVVVVVTVMSVAAALAAAVAAVTAGAVIAAMMRRYAWREEGFGDGRLMGTDLPV